MSNTDRRLIEDLIPIREISAEATDEKRLPYGNISTLHLWWARRPKIAARAAIYSTLVSAPSSISERSAYIERMKKLCRSDVHNDILEQARKDILNDNNGQPPHLLDMFAGGGAIPLEALRLGCEAYAVDLNPIAHIIELGTVVYPQKYGLTLVDDVKKWGIHVIERTKSQLAEFYPLQAQEEHAGAVIQSNFTYDQITTQVSRSIKPIAYLWTRTVVCPNSLCRGTVPLVRQTWLRNKKMKTDSSKSKANEYAALRMRPDHEIKRVHFEVVQATKPSELGFDPEEGSKAGIAKCPFCGATVETKYIKEQGQNKQIDYQIMAVVATKLEGKGKVYLADSSIQSYMPNNETIQKKIERLCIEEGLSVPDEPLPIQGTLGFRVQAYGMLKWKELFTPRQLLTLLTFTAEVRKAYTSMIDEGTDVDRSIAITTYLGMMVDRLAENLSSLCRWNAVGGKLQGTFGIQALPMVWDFAEANPFGGSVGDALSILTNISNILEYLTNIGKRYSSVFRTTATSLPILDSSIDAVITDPPYYDNVPYADLSDFFYIWLKRSIGFLYPEHLSGMLTPKKQEAVAAAARYNGNATEARLVYEDMMAQSFLEAYRVLKPGAPLVCVYAHKTTLGWSTLIDALRRAGFIIVEAWPLDTELSGRMRAQNSAALASSIFLVARRRESQETGDYVHQVRPQLASIIEERLDTLLKEGVSGADLMIATIGAGLRAYTQFARVEMPNGDELDAKAYLVQVQREVIQHMLKRLMHTQQNGEQDEQASKDMQIAAIDTTTLFYVIGRFFYGDAPVPFDDMNLLARGMGLELVGPHGLTQGKKGLAKTVKDTAQLMDYHSRGDDESLGMRTESGNPAPLIDVLQRILWLQEEQPYKIQDFLMQARPHDKHLRQVAETLAGPALAPTNGNGTIKHEKTEEKKAVETLVQGWRGVFSERARSGERSTRNMTLWEE